MNRIRFFAAGSLLMFALTALAQQPGVPAVGDQLKVLTAKLDLTADQQAKMTPILEHLHDVTAKLVEDKSLTEEQRLDKVRPVRFQTRDQMRAILTDDQKKKLDQYLQGPHNEMHGELTGHPPPAAQPKN